MTLMRPFVSLPPAPQAYSMQDQNALRRALAQALDSVTNVTGNQAVTLTGDATGSGAGTLVTTLATVNANTGAFGSSTYIPTFTVNGKGLITAASGNAVIAPASTLTGTTLAANVVTSSLTTIGTLVAGAVPASLVTAGTFGAGAYTFPSTLVVTSTLTQNGSAANLVQSTTTSTLGVATGTGSGSTNILVRSAAAQYAQFIFQTGTVNRWALYKDIDAESGSDAGSTLRLNAWTDAGVFIDNVLSITRAASGIIAFARPVTMSSTLSGITTLTATTLGGTLSTASQANVTSLGTLTALQVDNINLNGNAISPGTSRLDIEGSPALVVAGIYVNQAVTVSAAGFGSALGFFGSVTQGSDGNSVIGIDLNNISLGTGGFAAGTHYGIRLPPISSGGTNYSIYSAGGAFYHAGVVGFGIPNSATAQLTLPAGTTGVAPLRVTHGVAPSSPVNGDVWGVSAASLFYRNNGVTQYASWTRQSAITAPTGGAVIDSEARTAINAIRTALATINITA